MGVAAAGCDDASHAHNAWLRRAWRPAAPSPAMSDLRYRDLKPGDPGPWFHQRCTSNERYAFDTVGGRWVLLALLGSAAAPWWPPRAAWIQQQRARWNDNHLALFGVSVDPLDEREHRLAESMPGIRHFWDGDGAVSRLYGALPLPAEPAPAGDSGGTTLTALAPPVQLLASGLFRPLWVLLSPSLQVRAVLPFAQGAEGAAELPELQSLLERLPAVGDHAGPSVDAPILVVPEVFEPELRRALVAQYEAAGGEASGFMREEGGRTVGRHDPRHKVRRDHLLESAPLIAHVQRRILARLVPMVHRAYQFQVTRMERYLVACYDAAEGAHFRAHRDNTTRGTAHRRFAVTINLNDDFDGGTLSFPEFGTRRYKPAPGAALVFSCSLLHQVDVVTRGRRLAFLPFLYDDAAAALREANRVYLDDSLG
jgi:predicted 2-oxoglutarate/Fe(II)-dependent dioxygenase YbiX